MPLTVRTKVFDVRVATRGAETVSGNVDFTIAGSLLAAAPTIPGPAAYPIDGRTEARAVNVEVVDANDVLTEQLADGNGRMHLLGRLVELRLSVDGGAYSPVFTGRLADLLEREPGVWVLKIEDERWVERHSDIFTTSGTTQIWPSALMLPWRGFPGVMNYLTGAVRRSTVLAVGESGIPANKGVLLRKSDALVFESAWLQIPETVKSWIASDLIDLWDPNFSDLAQVDLEAGNFRSLRLNIGGVDFGIVWFGKLFGGDFQGPADPAALDERNLWVNVLDPDDLLDETSVGDPAFLHAPDAEPTEDHPLHIGMNYTHHSGTNWGSGEGYIHPFELAKRIYEHIGARIDEAAFDALIADKSYFSIAERVTSKENTAHYLEERIFKPNQVVPFVDNQGRISPKSVRLPTDVDPNNLFVFNTSNVATPITFEHTSRDVVNQLTFISERMRPIVTGHPQESRNDTDWPLDGLITKEMPRTVGTDDGVSESVFGQRAIEYNLKGIKHPGEVRLNPEQQKMYTAQFDSVVARIRREVFDRFQDGPIRGSFVGLPSTESVQAGDFVVLNHDSLLGPNPITNARSGQRIVQILRKNLTIVGPEFEFLDAGPFLQPLPAPTVSIAAHPTLADMLRVTLSNVPAGADVTVQVGYGGSFPPVWVHTWTNLQTNIVDVSRPPTGTIAWVRAQSTAPGRIRSLWATDSVAIANIPRILRAELIVLSDEVTIRAEVNAPTNAVRIYYDIYPSNEEPGDLDEFEDFAADGDDEWTLSGVVVPAGHSIAVRVVPYPVWTGTAASGTPGTGLGMRADLLGVIPVTTASFSRKGNAKVLRLAVEPGNATIFYRIVTSQSAAWQSASGPSIDITLSLLQGSQLVEYYSQLPNGVTEDVHEIQIDEDDDPEFDELVLAEPVANRLRVRVIGMDDDCWRWSVWARRGAEPWLLDVNGNPTDLPDPQYLRHEGMARESNSITFHANDGTWYVLVRAYDERGHFAQAIDSISIPTTPVAVGELSSVNVAPPSGGGAHRITWGHNAAAATGHRVVIRETLSGITREVLTLAAARSPTLEAGSGDPDTPNAGGFDVPVEEGTTFRHYDYEILLYNGTQFVNSYSVSIEGSYYAAPGSGGGGGGGAPTIAPAGLTLVAGEGEVTLTWGNTSTSFSVELDFQEFIGGKWRSFSTVSRPSPTPATYTEMSVLGGSTVRAWARYVNAAGAGPWSNVSNTVFVPIT